MKNLNKENYKKLYLILSVLIVVVILSMLIYIVRKRDKQITEDTQYTMSRETVKIKESLESSMGYAFNSIKVTASEISKRITGDEIEAPTQLIRELLPNTPFTSIEYIRADGTNITEAGEYFDASDREYYINGMAGKTGIWINYTPNYSSEPLLNFYTPIVYEDRIVGVLTGTLGCDTSMAPLLIYDYFGETVIGILLDEDNNVVTSTEPAENKTDVVCEGIGILENHKEEFSEILSLNEDTVIQLHCKNGLGVGYMSVMPSTGWKIIEIVPAGSLRVIKYKSNRFAYIMLATVLVTFIIYFSLIVMMNRRIFSKDIERANAKTKEQFDILKSMAEIYYSMHLINLTENTVVEYSSRNEVKDIVNQKSDADMQMRAIMTATVEDEYLDRILKFTDLTTLSERMKDKKNISYEFVAKNYGWFRCEFIAVETDEQTGCPDKVMFTTQIIDEEKRREEELKLWSSTDGLTGLLNRRAYIEDISEKERQGVDDSLVYLAIDINGLKSVNDKLGHEAGDELIRGASECIAHCFKDYGKAYRIGGDELVVIFNADEMQLEKIKAGFEKTVAAWSGEVVGSLSLSCGYACAKEYPGKMITDLANIADKRMYEAKAEYYKKGENDRRNRRSKDN